jgi:hypothetical protein
MHISSCRRLAWHGFLRGRVLRTRQAPVNLSSMLVFT